MYSSYCSVNAAISDIPKARGYCYLHLLFEKSIAQQGLVFPQETQHYTIYLDEIEYGSSVQNILLAQHNSIYSTRPPHDQNVLHSPYIDQVLLLGLFVCTVALAAD